MKTNGLFLALASIGFLAVQSPAFAAEGPSWTVPVQRVQASFGCVGSEPDLTGSPAVNLYVGDRGAYRVGELSSGARWEVHQSALFLISDENSSLELGRLGEMPSCFVQDTGDPATASWVDIDSSPDLSLSLQFTGDVSTCRLDRMTDDGYVRTNQLELVLTDRLSGESRGISWTLDSHYSNESECKTAKW